MNKQPVKLIFDTDMALDVDDAGALALLHALQDDGECGCNVQTGKVLGERYTIGDNPVAMAWHWYNGGNNRSSWDELTALFAVRGAGAEFEVTGPGRTGLLLTGHYIANVLHKSRNTWVADPNGPHFYLRPAVGYDRLAGLIDELMAREPRNTVRR